MSSRRLVNGLPSGSSERKFRSFAEGLGSQVVWVDARKPVRGDEAAYGGAEQTGRRGCGIASCGPGLLVEADRNHFKITVVPRLGVQDL